MPALQVRSSSGRQLVVLLECAPHLGASPVQENPLVAFGDVEDSADFFARPAFYIPKTNDFLLGHWQRPDGVGNANNGLVRYQVIFGTAGPGAKRRHPALRIGVVLSGKPDGVDCRLVMAKVVVHQLRKW